MGDQITNQAGKKGTRGLEFGKVGPSWMEEKARGLAGC